MTFDEKHLLMNNYFIANFNYCLLVWMLSSANSLKKLKNLQKMIQRVIIKVCHLCHECKKIKSALH